MKTLLHYWKLTQSIGKKAIDYSMFDFVRHVDNDVFGVVLPTLYDRKLLIVPAGSNDIKDWFSNLKFLRLPQNEDVHTGFYESAKKMRPYIEYFVKMFSGGFDEIVIIGHSRGKCLAVEIARYLEKYLGLESKVIGFGGPAEGGKAHYEECKDLGLKVDLYEYPRDIITKLPPGFVKYGKVHTLKQPWYFCFPIFIYIHCNYQHGLKML